MQYMIRVLAIQDVQLLHRHAVAWLFAVFAAVFRTTCLEELEDLLTNCSFDKRERGFQQHIKQALVRRDACLLLCRQS